MAAKSLRTDVFASDYNQMDEDFYNPELNSYDTGPGSHLRRSMMKEGTNVKLHVSNIPTGLSEEGLMNIFSCEGDIPENVYINRKFNQQTNTCWGFVTFNSLSAAQAAMCAINKRPPHNFYVRFAKSSDDVKSEGSRYSDEKHSSDNKSARNVIVPSARGRGRLPPMRGQPPSTFKAIRSNCESFIDDFGEDYCPGRFSHCGTSFEHNASNSVFSQFADGEYDDGKRKMTMGRGSYIASKNNYAVEHVNEEVEDMEHKVAAYLSNQLKDFIFNKDEIISSESKLSLPIKPGNCSYCARPAIYICSKCKSWYCTNYCRKKHWKVHKNVCVSRVLEFQDGCPVYKPITQTSYNDNSNKTDIDEPEINNYAKSNGHHFMNEYINGQNSHNSDGEDKPSKTLANNGVGRNNFEGDDIGNTDRHEEKKGGQHNESFSCRKQPRRRYERVESNVFVKPSSLLIDENNKTSNMSDPPIPANVFTKVTIGVLEKENKFYAFKLEDCIKQSNIMTNLKALYSCGNTNNIRIDVGVKCAAPFEGDWYRAVIIGVFDENVAVKFIDFGNESVVPKNVIGALPEDISTEPPMAHSFVLAASVANPKLEEGLTLAVKPVSQDHHGRWIVHAEGVSYSPVYQELNGSTAICQVQEKEAQLNEQVKHYLSLLKNHEYATLHIEKIMNDEFLTGSITDSGRIPLYEEISKILAEEVRPQNDMKLVPGMTLAAKWKDHWYRGYLMLFKDRNPVVALIDKGRVVIPEATAALPEKVSNILECGVRVLFEKPILNKEMGGQCVCIENIQHDYEKNHVQGEIKDFGNVLILPWVPAIEEAGLDCIPIPSRSRVQISSYHSPSAIYVQSCDPVLKTMRSELLQDVASYTKGENLKRKPWIGEFVACRYIEDGHYYRAQIFQKEGDKYKVNFVDYGNTELVSQTDMKYLPDNFKRVPCCAVKVGLKDVPDVPFNTQCMKFLNELAADMIEIFLTYENDLREVTLELNEGAVVNKILLSFLEPSWNKPDYNPLRAHVFMTSEIKYEIWKERSKFELTVASVIRHDTVLAIRPASGLLNHVEHTLTPLITEYCESKTNEPYNPRRSEVCLAKFHEDGKWYRAVCLKSYQHNAAEVFYLDYGNSGEVLHRCIRKMVPEFMEAPAVLKHCKIYGLPDCVAEPLLSEFNNYLSKLDRVEAEVLEELGEGNSIIWIPAVENFASQLGLTTKRPTS